jgi:uncharacterized integral membrane protein
MSRFLLILLLLAAALIALSVSAMNGARVDIELAFVRFASPLGVALIVSFAVGLLAGLAWQLKWVAQLLTERGRLRRALRLAEAKARGEGTTHK